MMCEYPTVSIIVPVYNVEKYLQRCVDSILAQTYQEIEVILVDDGSTDGCGKICDRYSEQYACIHTIHQKNQGQAAARNNAVLQSSGKYIVFVDSDDYIERDCIEYLLDLLERNRADVAIGGFQYVYDGGSIGKRSDESREIVMSPCEALIRMNYSMGFGATPWGKIYKKQLIVDHPFPVGQIYEDLATLYKILGDCNRVVFGSKKIYYWVQRIHSTTRKTFDERQMAGIDAAADQLHYVEQHFPEAVPAAKARYMGKVIEIMGLALNGKDAKKVYQRLKQKLFYYQDVMSDNKVKKSQKIRLLAVRCGFIPSKVIFSLHERMKQKYFS